MNYPNNVKGILDRVISFILLIALFPVMMMLGLLLFIIEGKVFFVQKRPGRKGRLFNIYKFVTMRDCSGPDEDRITKIGGFLRKYSLDELPQLWNVLSGQMSLIGPRPLLPEYLDKYSEVHRQRHMVKPGMTGLAQISGRNSLGWENKLDLDVYYVKHLDFFMDLTIFYKTIIHLFTRRSDNFIEKKFIGYTEH